MSWMDSWSRPGKSQATPAPYYLLPGGEDTPYCRSCGRVVGPRKVNAAAAAASPTTAAGSGTGTTSKYCSARCRNHKPGRLDREIEAAFVRMLKGDEEEPVTRAQVSAATIATEVRGGGGECNEGTGGSITSSSAGAKKSQQKREKHHHHKTAGPNNNKGDPRILVSCDEVERLIFGGGGGYGDLEETSARKKNSQEYPGTVAPPPGRHESPNINDLTTAEDENDNDKSRHYHQQAGDRDSGIAIYDDDSAELELELGSGGSSSTAVIDGDILARMAVRSGTRIRPPQSTSEVNGSVGGEKGRAERAAETEEMARRRLEGLRRARQRESVRCAARRLVVFGIGAGAGTGTGIGGGGGGGGGGGSKEKKKKKKGGEEGEGKKNDNKCEAVMQGKVVEPSFAKGDWGIRWRE